MLQRFEKLLKLEILERFVLGVRMGKSGPLKRARQSNQYQGFRIPNRWEAEQINQQDILEQGECSGKRTRLSTM